MSVSDSSVIGTVTVQDYAFSKRYQDFLNEEGNISETFPGYVKGADQFGQDIYAEVQKHQKPATDFIPDASALKLQQITFEQRLKEVKGQAEALSKLLERVSLERKEMSTVTALSAHTFESAGKIDPGFKRLLEKAFQGVAQNNKQLALWEQALTKLKQQMTTHILYAEKWLPTFVDIVVNDGKPLSSLQWYGLTAVERKEQVVDKE